MVTDEARHPVAADARWVGPTDGLAGIARLDELALLRVHGADAASFLQSQLTQDVQTLAPGIARLAGYCTPKGRLLATFWIWRSPDEADGFRLACSRDIAATVARRLTMYVLRAKARIESGTEVLFGLASPADGAFAPDAIILPPVRLALADPATAVLTIRRALVAVPAAQADGFAGSAGLGPLADGVWARLEVLSGIARIGAGSQELFVPQMVNLERTDGVSFRKGCYPGQEIVARSQYLGKLKRRLFIGIGDGEPPAPGTDVSGPGTAAAPGAEAGSGAEAGAAIGQVVLAAASAEPGRYLVQFESRIDGIDPAGPVAARIAGQPVRLLPLPYAMTDDVPDRNPAGG